MLWEKFQGLCEDSEYEKVVSALSAFDKWLRLASATDLFLSDKHLKSLCCPDLHVNDNCCATLVKCLEKLGFGPSLKIHVLAQHVGPFTWHHRLLGAIAEEGIEQLHRTIKEDFQNVSRRGDLERARITIQRWAVQVQLADLG